MSNETIYHLLGEISVTFASLEHRLVNVLEYLLTDGEDTLIRPYILDDIPFSRCIQQTRAVAKLRLWEYKSILEKLNKVLNNVDDFRVQRNIFIHGDWLTQELTNEAESVTVFDYRPRLDEKSGVWEYLKSIPVTRSELQTLLHKTIDALKELTSIDTEIRKLKLR